ncbi:hypothetical protein BDC45DRAFT_574374 [Circinella umbellata]|nr:hypothetical protein BDC45DRAFT_574374 [Circinella umbellata]
MLLHPETTHTVDSTLVVMKKYATQFIENGLGFWKPLALYHCYPIDGFTHNKPLNDAGKYELSKLYEHQQQSSRKNHIMQYHFSLKGDIIIASGDNGVLTANTSREPTQGYRIIRQYPGIIYVLSEMLLKRRHIVTSFESLERVLSSLVPPNTSLSLSTCLMFIIATTMKLERL